MSSADEAYKILKTRNEVENVEFKTFGEFDLSYVKSASIHFSNCIFHTGVVFSNDHETNAELVFINCEFKDQLEISGLSHISQIEISECYFEKAVVFHDCKIRSLKIRDSLFKSLLLHSVEVSVHCIIESSSTGLLELFYLKSGYIEIENLNESSYIKDINVNCPELDMLYINCAHKISRIELCYFKSSLIYNIPERIKLIKGDFESLKIVGSFFRDNQRMENFFARGFKQLGKVHIENIEIRHFDLIELDVSEATYSLFDVVIINVKIDSCVFSKFYCNQLFFEENPSIVKSDVSQFVTNNLSWGKDKRNRLAEHSGFDGIPPLYRFCKKYYKRKQLDFDRDDIVELKDLKDTYRQLKKAALANGNLIDALKFRTNEMQVYWREIRLIGGANFGDTALIFLNRFTSNFGQSWILPLVWLFAFHLLLFSFLMNFYWYNSFGFDFEFGQFWVLLNPVHKTPDYVNTGAGLFTEFAMRITNAYFIYHFVRASRKFSRI